MAKVPVGRTIGFAYGFLFRQIGTVLAVAGIPALAFAATDYASRALLAAEEAANGADAEPSGSAALALLATLLVAIMATAVTALAMVRVVLAQQGSPASLPFPETALRMAGAYLRLIGGAIVLLGLAAGITFAAYRLAGIPLDGNVQIALTPQILVAALISWVVFAYALVSILRMGFLLPAVVASEPKGGLKRSHELSAGNTGRLFVIAVTLALPIVFLMMTATGMIMRSALGEDFAATAITPELMQRVERAIAERLAAWETFNAVIFVLYSGLIYSGAAYAYRAALNQRQRKA